jgi:hypothetical protein
MKTKIENIESAWVEVTQEERDMIKSQKTGTMPSPKVFTLKDDGNNADGNFAALDRRGVLLGAQDSVAYLKKIGFAKS